jgi:hypothetical protein
MILFSFFKTSLIGVRKEEIPHEPERRGGDRVDLVVLSEQLRADPLGLEVVEQVFGLGRDVLELLQPGSVAPVGDGLALGHLDQDRDPGQRGLHTVQHIAGVGLQGVVLLHDGARLRHEVGDHGAGEPPADSQLRSYHFLIELTAHAFGIRIKRRRGSAVVGWKTSGRRGFNLERDMLFTSSTSFHALQYERGWV